MKWPIVQLGQLGKFINGKAFKPSEWSDIGRPIIRIQNLNDPNKPFNRFTGECEKKYSILKGDILISWSASLGVFVWNGENALLNQHIFKVIPREDLIYKDFFIYAIESALDDMKRKVHGATMRHIVKKDFDSTPIPLPPPSEQRRIVEILDQADQLRKLRVEADKKAERILPVLFIKMFGDPATNPMGWKTSPFEKLVEIGTQLVDPNRNRYKTLPHIGGEHIESNTGRILPYETVENCQLRSNKFHFSSRHILFSKIRPYLNKVAFPQFDGLCSADIYPLSPKNDQITPWYLISLLRSQAFLDYAKIHSDRLRIPKLNKTQLGAFETPTPDNNILEKFELQAEKIMKLGRFGEMREEKIEKIFSVMLYRAFTGDLTASWRQSHMKELLQEMELQAKALAS